MIYEPDWYKKLAKIIVNHSLEVKKGEKILISTEEDIITESVVTELLRIKALPMIDRTGHIARTIANKTTVEHVMELTEKKYARYKEADKFIHIRSEESDEFKFSESRRKLFRELNKKIREDKEISAKPWVLLKNDSPAMRKKTHLGNGLEEYMLRAMVVDYKKMGDSMTPLVELMEKTDRVHILGHGVDLRFSIKGIPVVKCNGKRNIPDGEVFTAPVKESVEGFIEFDLPSPQGGLTFNRVNLEFENGKIVKAFAGHLTAELLKELSVDEGSRFIGEFALGVNNSITKPMNDILFDEKIGGSFHFTPGNSYDDADNGNKSSLHWDLVHSGRHVDIYFDDVLVRRDGKFVVGELMKLNV